VAGAISDGFKTTALPAAIAPITGSSDSTETTEIMQYNISAYHINSCVLTTIIITDKVTIFKNAMPSS
jgi:hypothetical protein